MDRESDLRGIAVQSQEQGARFRRSGTVARLVARCITPTPAVHWPQYKSGNFVGPSGVCIRTMHSAKGLQLRAGLVMRRNLMAFLPDSDRAEQERLARPNVRRSLSCRSLSILAQLPTIMIDNSVIG